MEARHDSVTDLSIEAVVRELKDRSDIAAVLYTYARSIDTNDFDAVSRCFTDDATWDYGPEAGPVVTGGAAIKKFASKAYSDDPLEEGDVKVRHGLAASHHVSNVLIEFDGPDNARSESYVHTFHEMLDGSPGLVWGRWHDSLRRTPEGWKICARKMLLAGKENYPAIGYPVLGS
jgi:3-phenylpropionate/cinnamic acid dioxygenase small subunit